MLSVVLAFQPHTVWADSAEQTFAHGEKLLAKADFDGALKAFAQAAKADRSNSEYLQHYALVNQIVVCENGWRREQDAAQWENIARGLHAFYIGRGCTPKRCPWTSKSTSGSTPPIPRRCWPRRNWCSIAMPKRPTVLAALERRNTRPAPGRCTGLALARQGKTDEAREIAQTIELAAGQRSGHDLQRGPLAGGAGQHGRIAGAAEAVLRSGGAEPTGRLQESREAESRVR